MRIFISVFVFALLIAGCATAPKMNQITVGMTKQQVIEVLGQPASTSAKPNVEYLSYRLSHQFWGYEHPYFIRLINGRVDAYGRLGDFDSTKPDETKTTIDLNIKK